LLGVLIENKGSDLHVQSGEVPIGRSNARHREEQARHFRQFVRF
jgi:Tfp pilus assembly pilus retraction ATPase PilT